MESSIRTARLDLVPMARDFLRASIDGNVEDLGGLLGAAVPKCWPDRLSILELRLDQLEADPSLQPWLLRAMVLRESRAMIGHIGFHTKPGPSYLKEWSARGVEFGCTVFSAYRRRGFAREASLGLMQWAQDLHGVTEFVVSVGRENTASKALFLGLGFTKVGSHVDEVDGLEDILIRRSRAAA